MSQALSTSSARGEVAPTAAGMVCLRGRRGLGLSPAEYRQMEKRGRQGPRQEEA